MKRYLLILTTLLLIGNITYGQTGISILRYKDDNALLKADESDWGFHRAIKEMKLSQNEKPTLSIGGDVRLRAYQKFNPTFKEGEDNQHYFWQRILLHADLQINNSLRVFTQLGSMHMQGRDYIIPEIDNDRLDLMQAFVEIKFNLGTDMMLRIGRQELLYGYDRFLGLRDGPNVRQSNDAVKLTAQIGKFSSDFLVFKPVVNQEGVFDSKWNDNEIHYGTYWTFTNTKSTKFGFYYFGSERESATYTYADNTAKESRQSIGFRMVQSSNPFYYTTEMTYQFGKFGDDNISAFQQLAIIGYQFKGVKLKPTIQFKEFIASGDTNENDGKLGTFRTISSQPSTYRIFSFGSMNQITIVPEVIVYPTDKLKVMLRSYTAWRYSVNDVIYTPDNGSIYVGGTANDEIDGKTLIQGFEFDICYKPTKHIQIDPMLSIFKPGEFLKQNGKTENMKSLFLSLTYKF